MFVKYYANTLRTQQMNANSNIKCWTEFTNTISYRLYTKYAKKISAQRKNWVLGNFFEYSNILNARESLRSRPIRGSESNKWTVFTCILKWNMNNKWHQNYNAISKNIEWKHEPHTNSLAHSIHCSNQKTR